MRNTRTQAATKVAKHLFVVEHAVDTAAAESSEFISTMLAARGEANLSAIFGQDALDQVAEAVSLIVRARRHFVEAHRQLDQVKIDIGLREVGFGDLGKKPPFAAVDAAPVPVA